jgi:hypothetical protein
VREEDVRQAARAIRPYLRELLEDDELAAATDRRLAELLAGTGTDQGLKIRLLGMLTEHPATRAWTREFMKDKIPPETRRGSRPPGDPIDVPAQPWACPHGDFEWYPSTTGEPSPLCPTHSVPVEPDR